MKMPVNWIKLNRRIRCNSPQADKQHWQNAHYIFSDLYNLKSALPLHKLYTALTAFLAAHATISLS